MRQIFWILLFCLAFENALTDLDPERRNRLGKIIKFMKVIKEINERKQRKLEGTDESDSDTGANGTYVSPKATPFDNATNSNPEGKEVGEAIAENGQVPADKPVSTTTPLSNNKDNNVQILKFHSFKIIEKLIKFSSIFYFIRQKIPYAIFLRLRVRYSSRLRNLQTEMADSLRTECKIDPSAEEQAGEPATGNNINYNCEAEATQDPTGANVTLNTDYDLMFYDKNGDPMGTIPFTQVSMNGNASQEAANLQDNNKEASKFGTLKSSSAEGSSSTLTIKGTPKPTDILNGVSKIKMDLMDNNKAVKQYDCDVSTESSQKVLACDASSQQISTNSENIHLSSGLAEKAMFLLKLKVSDRNSDSIRAGRNNPNTL